MTYPATWAALALLVLAPSCDSRDVEESTPEGGNAERTPDAGDTYDADTGSEPDPDSSVATCTGSPLHGYGESPAILEQLWVDLPSGDTTVPFIVDMGSPISYWAGPPLPDGGLQITEDGGATTISCAPWSLPTIRGVTLGSAPGGVPAAGALGVDLIVTRGAALDLQIADGRFVWWHTPPPRPVGATVVPLTIETFGGAYNKMVASGIQLDGKDVRLILDTGSPHVVLLSSTPRPGERTIHGEDANGEPLTLYSSTIEIAFGDGTKRTVVMDRAVRFPALEKTIAAIGADVVGLLGLDALGHERIVISRDNVVFVP